jgi:hypothetical protein
MKEQETFRGCTAPAALSVVVLVRHWPLSDSYQQQLLALAQLEVVHELILVGKQMQELPPLLIKEPKLRSFQLNSDSSFLMAEAGAFEAAADVLVILQQGVKLSAQMLQKIPLTVAEGYEFGGLIAQRNRWWTGILKLATASCKGLCWFRLSQGYFASRKIYHHSGGFKQDGRMISFFELLCKQQKLSPYTFLFLPEQT